MWVRVARASVGLRETVGPGTNPVIQQWAHDLKVPAWYDDDDKAWCALAVNRWLLACDLPLSGTGFDLLRAHSFTSWGSPLPAPVLGAVLVFKRDGGFHVGFCTGELGPAWRVLGGNQGNAVSEVWLPKDRLVASRWPAGVPLPAVVPGSLLAEAGSAAPATSEA